MAVKEMWWLGGCLFQGTGRCGVWMVNDFCLVGFMPVPYLHPLNIHGMFFCSLVLCVLTRFSTDPLHTVSISSIASCFKYLHQLCISGCISSPLLPHLQSHPPNYNMRVKPAHNTYWCMVQMYIHRPILTFANGVHFDAFS